MNNKNSRDQDDEMANDHLARSTSLNGLNSGIYDTIAFSLQDKNTVVYNKVL